ncbi:hypothetical protein DL98DRAFT_544599 [Cadophora sp. DSE1049]|nr:hypothetical protein DL98DRAFT_544599 [Cadophora sp. DSE1049]
MAPLKIIGAGYGRTGTLSLCEALDILGLPCHHMEKVILDPTQDASVFRRAFDEGFKPDWDEVFRNYDAAVDWPAAAFWEELWQTYPDGKVILTVRDPEEWYRSVGMTIRDWPMGPGEKWPERMLEARLMARSVVRQGVLRNYSDKDKMIKQFKEHIEHVKRIVPKKQLLVLGLGEGWGPLCHFLGLPVPKDIPYPFANVGVNFGRKMLEVRDIVLSQPGEQEKLEGMNGSQVC